MATKIANLASYFDEELEPYGEDAASMTQVTKRTLIGKSSTPDAEAKGLVADEKDEAEDNE